MRIESMEDHASTNEQPLLAEGKSKYKKYHIVAQCPSET
jgi:hypothetical protein